MAKDLVEKVAEALVPDPFERLVVGRVVWMNAGDIGGPLAAMVAWVWQGEPGIVNLSVLGKDGTWNAEYRVDYDETGEKPRSWRWPERK